ncbi:hypothetical protein B0T49_06940 [Chromobacterium violaceum]|uniref:major capsid protein n=1 Tax=Chromobacterium violaceum TaxID=536 RepID=UPI0009DA3FA9|nr:major capsid protein [Chromobacterium violaceum]MCD0494494.1 major capsid protein [Chromobacterium violaceum]OQS44019.1 hypothetical protein B0T48_21860 [Chromobacterium violaceum]OQS45266.1 hypothetical protein B0T49_21780 [Chromobacterium violaceum]OQS46890.1 hypothetical protein B0T48_13910 [Chromobacterium violaceum]OQS51733.1 hypothetical protein B0T49_06940 [Chromobacterium violaceum]
MKLNLKKTVPVLLAVVALPAFADGTPTGVDVTTVVATIAGGAVAVGLIGSSKTTVQAVVALWGMVKGAVGRG